MAFLLTPPLVLKNTGFSLIQVGDMEWPESMQITMGHWSAVDLLKHWRSEIGHILSGDRDRCCIICELTSRRSRKSFPCKWWKVYAINGEARFHSQIIAMVSIREPLKWQKPDSWWKNISDYTPWADTTDKPKRRISEWTASFDDLAAWCEQCDALVNAIRFK
jgi:hypothetical protein